MKYISTRGKTAEKTFSEALLMGLAPDGGLILPEYYPKITTELLDEWRVLSYPALAGRIIGLFATDIPQIDLQNIINKTYTANVFGTDDIVPTTQLRDGVWIAGLSNGPTLAFKDMAMQFLGNLFEYVLTQKKQHLNIIGATSGDTGSAAEYALRGKNNINVFMLSPHGKMSSFQRAQMYSIQDKNIYNIAIEGMFDDCQDIIKNIQNDEIFKNRYQISTVNSINWGRIVAQIVYYFKAYFSVSRNNHERISFCVPSGNFGNVLAGHIARMMGLPINRLIVATNENDVLDEFFKTGIYQPRTSENTFVTSSPSMDISKASNFERFIFDLLDKDTHKIQSLWVQVSNGKGFDLSEKLGEIHEKYGFVSGRSLAVDRLNTIAQVYQEDKRFIDPHTADGLKVARDLRKEQETIICLETAQAVKFSETIHKAIGDDIDIPLPPGLQDIEKLPQRVTVLPKSVDKVRLLIQVALGD